MNKYILYDFLRGVHTSCEIFHLIPELDQNKINKIISNIFYLNFYYYVIWFYNSVDTSHYYRRSTSTYGLYTTSKQMSKRKSTINLLFN